MLLDPDKLDEAPHAEMLEALSKGLLSADHRLLRAFIDRPAEALPAVVTYAKRDRSEDKLDIAQFLISLLRYWQTPQAVPFLIDYIKEEPEDVPDDVVYTLVPLAPHALEPLLALYAELEESESGEVAFLLANLDIHDPRILKILTDRLEYDLPDTLLLLGMYGDIAAIPAIDAAAATLDSFEQDLAAAAAAAIAELNVPDPQPKVPEPYDIWDEYAEEADLPVSLLDEDEREGLLTHPAPSVRAAVASFFFNATLTRTQRIKLFEMARHDSSAEVRARCWEALAEATEDTEVVEAMLAALRNPALPVDERGGLLVGLAPEADRNEVRSAIAAFYEVPAGRAKALEAMWRSMHASFRDYFLKHLDDEDLEVRRSAVWGVGYFAVKSGLAKLRQLFQDEDLRTDALFAYALAVPAEISRSRMQHVLSRVEKDAGGFSELEEELVKAALDERLVLVGKEPFFRVSVD